jgi:translation initiation factor 5A
MSDHEEETFENADSGAASTVPMQCSTLRKGGHVVMKGRPCKVVEMSTSKTGKHGHAKVNLVGIDIFNGRKYEDMSPSTHNMDVPIVKRKDYELLAIDEEGFVSLLDDTLGTKEDLKLPEGELGVQIREAWDKDNEAGMLVTVVSAMGEEAILAFKNKPSGKD